MPRPAARSPPDAQVVAGFVRPGHQLVDVGPGQGVPQLPGLPHRVAGLLRVLRTQHLGQR